MVVHYTLFHLELNKFGYTCMYIDFKIWISDNLNNINIVFTCIFNFTICINKKNDISTVIKFQYYLFWIQYIHLMISE